MSLDYGDVVRIKVHNEECPFVGYPKGTIGVVADMFLPLRKYRIITSEVRCLEFTGWWYHEDDLEFLNKNAAVKRRSINGKSPDIFRDI